MPIINVETLSGGDLSIFWDAGPRTVGGDTPSFRKRWGVDKWLEAGNEIQPYVAPPPPPPVDRMLSVSPNDDRGNVTLEALFNMENRLRALEGSPPLANVAQYRALLQAKLP